MDHAMHKPFVLECQNKANWEWDVIWAKFSSFFSHACNKQAQNLANPLFNKCAHADEIPPLADSL